MRIAGRDGEGSRSVVRGVLLALAGLVLASGSAGARLPLVIDDPFAEDGGAFGSAVATAGTALFVGAPGESVSDHAGAGVVQLFDDTGVLQQTFQAPIPVTDAAFGTKVLAGDGLLYASAPGDRPLGVGGLGAVYVVDVGNGAVLAILRAPSADASGMPVGGRPLPPGAPPQSTAPLPEAIGFGEALAVAGDVVVVGAPSSTVDGVAGAGGVFVFDTLGGLLYALQEFPPTEHGRFGESLAVIDGRLFVGEPGAPANGVDGAGAVSVYDVGTGDLVTTLISPAPAEGAAFGAVVGEIDGRLFVGAPGDPALGLDGVGAVYLFDVDPAVLPLVVPAPVPTAGLGFGRAVIAVAGNLLVGAPGGPPSRAGVAYLIDPATSAVRATFTPSTPRADGAFGSALALLGTAIVIGEPAAGGASAIGRVYLFNPASGSDSSTSGRNSPTAGITTPAPLAAGCGGTATMASVDCRLEVLFGSALHAGENELAVPLRRARRDFRRARGMRGRRRHRALARAGEDVRAFSVRLAADGGTSISSDLRTALVDVAATLASDLTHMAGASSR